MMSGSRLSLENSDEGVAQKPGNDQVRQPGVVSLDGRVQKFLKIANVVNELKDKPLERAKGASPEETGDPAETLARSRRSGMCDEQWEMIEFCVRLARLFGVPKSVGEIFGFVFCASSPVAFENVVAGLGISGGSASHGLRLLRQLGALKLTYVARDRRDFYVAETSARRLFAGFLHENVLQEANENRQRLRELHTKLSRHSPCDNPNLLGRVELLMDWNKQGSMALQAVMEILGA